MSRFKQMLHVTGSMHLQLLMTMNACLVLQTLMRLLGTASVTWNTDAASSACICICKNQPCYSKHNAALLDITRKKFSKSLKCILFQMTSEQLSQNCKMFLVAYRACPSHTNCERVPCHSFWISPRPMAYLFLVESLSYYTLGTRPLKHTMYLNKL